MRARKLKSSVIERVAFDDEAHVLTISFRRTGKYLYYDVPRAIYDALCAASSAGAYFNACVKGRFRCRPDPERRRFRPA